jgi:hypothetical protein
MSRSRKRCSMCIDARLGCNAALKYGEASDSETGHPTDAPNVPPGPVSRLSADEEYELYLKQIPSALPLSPLVA